MVRTSTILAALLALPLACAAAGPHVLRHAGDAAVAGDFIVPYKVKWKINGAASDGKTKDGGTWTDDVQIVKFHGRDVIQRKQVWNYVTGTETYVNLLDRKTMMPLLSEFTSTPGIYWRFEYSADGKTVRYQRSPPPRDAPNGPYNIADPMEQGTVHPDVPVWDFNGGLWGLLLSAFPLEQGYAAKFPVFPLVEPNAKPVWVDFTVGEKRTLPAGPGKTAEGWTVVANSPATQEVMRFVLSKQPPYILELKQEWAGYDWTFEIVSAELKS